MLKRKLTVLLLALSLVVAVALPGCTSDSEDPDPTNTVTKIRVATDATWQPFEYVDTTNNKGISEQVTFDEV